MAFVGPVVICLFAGRNIILNLVADKRERFRATFKLMGLSDSSYVLGSLLFQVFQTFAMVSVFLFFEFLSSNGSLGVFASNKYSLTYVLNSYLYVISTLGFCNLFSQLITGTVAYSEFTSAFVGITTVLPIFSIFKDNSDSSSKINSFEKYTIFMPTTAYVSDLRLNYVREFREYDPFATKAFVIQILVYFLLFFIIENISNGSLKKPTKASGVENSNASGLDEFQNNAHEDNEQGMEASNTSFHTGGRKVIEVKNLVQTYGSFRAIDNLSLNIYSDVVTCILGHNGAGKTTLMNTICGILNPTSGSILLNGSDVYRSPEVLQGNVGYCSSNEVLYENMTVSEFLMFIALIKCVEEPFPHVTDILNRCELMEYSGQRIKYLSGGTKRRTSIAASVIGNPSVVFLDEPSSGVDPENRRKIWDLIENIKNPDSAIILTTHHLEEAEFLSEDVIVMQAGKVTNRGTPKSIVDTFGFGYRLSFSRINQNVKQKIETSLKSVSPHVKILDHNYVLDKRFTAVIPIEDKHKMPQILANVNIHTESYGIDGCTLEESFVNLCEQANVLKFSLEEIEQEMEELFKVTYRTTEIRRIWALFYRRIIIFFASPVQLVLFVYIIVLPCAGIWLISEPTLDFNKIYYSPIIVSVIYFFVCTFYADLPYFERKKRIRYLLKMNGVNSISYYMITFIVDFLLSLIVIFLTLGYQLYFWRNDYNFEWDDRKEELAWIFVYTIMWSATFMTQSNFFINFSRLLFRFIDEEYKQGCQNGAIFDFFDHFDLPNLPAFRQFPVEKRGGTDNPDFPIHINAISSPLYANVL